MRPVQLVLSLTLLTAACSERTHALVIEETEPLQLLSVASARCVRLRAVTDSGVGEARADSVRWSSSSPEVADVDRGCITPKRSGRTTVHARRGDAAVSLLVVVALPASLELTPGVIELRAPGATAVPRARVRDESGRPIAELPIQWTLEPSAVAEVSASGVISAKAPGTAMLVARAGELSASATVVVCPAVIARLVAERATYRMKAGESREVKVRAIDVRGKSIASPLRITWTASGQDLRVSHDGVVSSSSTTRAVLQASACGKRVAVMVDVAE